MFKASLKTLGFDGADLKLCRQPPPIDMPTQHPSDPHDDLTTDARGVGPGLGVSIAPLDEAALDRIRALDPRGDQQLVKRVIGAFQLSLEQAVLQLKAAAPVEDLTSVRHVVHTLKSSAANVGANQLSQRCAELESLIRIDKVDNLEHRIEGLCAEIALLTQALKALLESQA